ncbi:MAG: ABC transporter ATP-binding protein [Planctomycetota bacterium]|nr:ABC transporter ATP-binding protein [Planctomycetota bacterium]MDA1138360.1 ABC transporter ATP-binding protein [Planctomycetota bacterium]
MIQIEDLHKSFDSHPVLRGLSCEVKKGEFLALIGMSGSGKSVLLKHIAGMIRPDKGRIILDGHDLAKIRGRELEALRKRFGVVFQQGALFDSLTVYDNIAFPLREKLKLRESEIRERVHRQLEAVSLKNAEDKYPAEISGGMAKRTALARALITEPEIMFFDEPTTGLDPIIANSILKLFKSCHERFGFTGIIVSHDIPEVFDIVDRVAMLHEGVLIKAAPPNEFRNSEDALIRQFITGSTEGPIQAN